MEAGSGTDTDVPPPAPGSGKRMSFNEAAYYAQYYNVPLDDAMLREHVDPATLPEHIRAKMAQGPLTAEDINGIMFGRLGIKAPKGS